MTSSLFSRIRWPLLLCLLLIAGGALGFRIWRGPLVSVETVSQRDLLQTVVASGHVESPHRVEIGTSITATVTRVPVQEGQTVQAGQLLIQLNDEELQASARQADMVLAQAQARLRQLAEVQRPVAEQTQRQARANLDNARTVLKRNEELFQKNFIGAAALDEARKNLELADAQWHASQRQLETTQPSGSDYAVAETSVAQARASAEVARAKLHNSALTAPRAGVLIGRNVEVGDVVQPGKVLMTLSPAGKTQLRASIDEKNLRLIALGQKAVASADAFPQQKFDATVSYINPGVNAQTGAVEVKLDIDKPSLQLQQDMTVSVDIEVGRQAHTLVLPATVLHDANGSPWVLRLEDGVAQKVAVQLGLRSGAWVEVRSGLQAGDQILPVGPDLVPGKRVRVQAPL